MSWFSHVWGVAAVCLPNGRPLAVKLIKPGRESKAFLDYPPISMGIEGVRLIDSPQSVSYASHYN